MGRRDYHLETGPKYDAFRAAYRAYVERILTMPGIADVKRHYPPASEAKMAELIANLRAAYKDRITAVAWMDDKTKTPALAKLAAFDPRIGHPVKDIDYSALKITRGDPLGNAMRAGEFQHALDLWRLPKPVDRTLWDMTPQTDRKSVV